MSESSKFSPEEITRIRSLVKYYQESMFEKADRDAHNIAGHFRSKPLANLIHSIKTRAKDPSHLEDKLFRKLTASKLEGGKEFDITTENLVERVTDLAGVRLLHLHTQQFPEINAHIKSLLHEEGYLIIEGPEARTWDDEYRKVFEFHGIATIASERLYTSVHYIVQTSAKSKRTIEVQVRTLAEELWGEVDHSMNYPVPTEIHACKEQIKVLARLTSSCTRLVDSIFSTKGAAEKLKQ